MIILITQGVGQYWAKVDYVICARSLISSTNSAIFDVEFSENKATGHNQVDPRSSNHSQNIKDKSTEDYYVVAVRGLDQTLPIELDIVQTCHILHNLSSTTITLNLQQF